MRRLVTVIAVGCLIWVSGYLWGLAQAQGTAATVMQRVPAGPFFMGSDTGPADEQP